MYTRVAGNVIAVLSKRRIRMKILQMIDGYKTYIFLGLTAIFTVIEFMIKGDYSMSSFIVLSQQQSIISAIAALRHGIAKAGNQGVVTTGGK